MLGDNIIKVFSVLDSKEHKSISDIIEQTNLDFSKVESAISFLEKNKFIEFDIYDNIYLEEY